MSAVNIEYLKFFQDRLRYAVEPKNVSPHEKKMAEDRTVAVVRLWESLNKELRTARGATIACLEAIEGKGEVVTLKILDRPAWDALQEVITGNTSKISNLETAIIRLDELGGPWFSELLDRVNSTGREENSWKQRIATMTAAAIAKTGNEAEAEKDDEVVRVKQLAREATDAANVELKKLRPLLEEIESILEGVGC
jgi:hypothetical protein